MCILIFLLLCATTAATHDIPLIDGVDRSAVFNAALRELERHRLFVSIVDTVSYTPTTPPSYYTFPTFSIDLTPSERHVNETDYPDYYDLVTRRVAEVLGCTEASDNTADAKNYVLQVQRDFFPFSANGTYIDQAAMSHPHSRFGADYLSDPGDALFASKFSQLTNDDLRGYETEGKMPVLISESGTMVRAGCTYKRSPGIMRLTFNLGPSHQLRSGWIVESTPVGLYFDQENKTVFHATELCIAHSYIDGISGAVYDVSSQIDNTAKSRSWTPKRTKKFHPCGRLSRVIAKNQTDRPYIRETAAGVVVSTNAPTMFLSYKINGDLFQERIDLRGNNHYHVSCVRKELNAFRDTMPSDKKTGQDEEEEDEGESLHRMKRSTITKDAYFEPGYSKCRCGKTSSEQEGAEKPTPDPTDAPDDYRREFDNGETNTTRTASDDDCEGDKYKYEDPKIEEHKCICAFDRGSQDAWPCHPPTDWKNTSCLDCNDHAFCREFPKAGIDPTHAPRICLCSSTGFCIAYSDKAPMIEIWKFLAGGPTTEDPNFLEAMGFAGVHSTIVDIIGDPSSPHAHRNTTTNDGVEISTVESTLAHGDKIRRFHCKPKRNTPTGIPEVLELEWNKTVHPLGRPIPAGDRTLRTSRINGFNEDVMTMQKPQNVNREDAVTTATSPIVQRVITTTPDPSQ